MTVPNRSSSDGATAGEPRALLLRRLTLLLFAVAAVGFGLRLYLALTTIGSNDTTLWHVFAREIRDGGLLQTYRADRYFNHPPLMGLWAFLGVRLDGVAWAFWMRLPGLVGEAGTAWLLFRIVAPRGRLRAAATVAAFAWCVDSILVAGYHGNTDALYAFLCLLSAWLLDDARRPFAGGLALGAALNVKLIPIMLVPLFASRFRDRAALARYLGGLAVAAIPFVPVLVGAGAIFWRNAIAYNSKVDYWGIQGLLLHSLGNPRLGGMAARAIEIYTAGGRYLVLGLATALAAVSYRTDRWSRYQLGALGLSLFLVFTPGFGVQYTASVVPLLFAASLEWAALYGAVAGLFVGVIYYSFATGVRPWFSQFEERFTSPGNVVGLLPWWVLLEYLLRTIFARRPNAGR